MNIGIHDHQGFTVVSMAGDIDMHTSPKLRGELLTLIQKRPSALCIDFAGVSYIDSSGIATFVEGLKGMKSYGGRMLLCAVPNGIMEIFNFSKLDRVFEIYTSIDEACRKAAP